MLQILSYKQSRALVKRVYLPSLLWRMSTLPAPVHRCVDGFSLKHYLLTHWSEMLYCTRC